jgi:thiamine transport system substrate-binding protein
MSSIINCLCQHRHTVCLKTHRSAFIKLLIIMIGFSTFMVLSATSCTRTPPSGDTLVIYAYDSFAGEWGPGPVVIPAFTAATGIKVELIAAGDAGQVLARVIDERKKPRADIIIGIDNHLLSRALEADVLVPYQPANAARVPAELVLDAQWRLTPFDWSSFAIIWDSERLAIPPTSLEDLTKADYARKLILMDPRSSTPGLGFLAWTLAVYGDGMADYWRRLAPTLLTMAPGWDTGYGLFIMGEAPLVISYTTSPAYHAEYETAGRYIALEFAEGHPLQIEGVGIIKGTSRRPAAEAFLDFVLSPQFQEAIPLTNWMYPVIPATALPDSYAHAPKPAHILRIDPADLKGKDRIALDALTSP